MLDGVMRVISWNVNGLRAIMQKDSKTGRAAGSLDESDASGAKQSNFSTWLNASGADVVGLQEVRATEDQLKAELKQFEEDGWTVHISAAKRKGYSGTALLSRKAPDQVITTVGVDEFDVEGRLQIARFGQLTIVNGYFPNGNGKERDNSRIPYKLAFYKKLFETLEPDRTGGDEHVGHQLGSDGDA